jgi:hypothetical protein
MKKSVNKYLERKHIFIQILKLFIKWSKLQNEWKVHKSEDQIRVYFQKTFIITNWTKILF